MDALIGNINGYRERIGELDSYRVDGRVMQITGIVIEATGRGGTVGDFCEIESATGTVKAEIVGFRNGRIWLMPLGDTMGVSPGSRVRMNRRKLRVPVGTALLGRVLNGLGEPIDGKGDLTISGYQPVYNAPPNPLSRQIIQTPLTTGVKAIDGLVTIGKGQRMGVFAGSGVGKSVLMGMISRYTDAQVNVIALIGERGREVREFIENNLGEEGLRRSVVVVATSDQAATVRIKAALIATSIAEYFRDLKMDVLLMMDSLTRVAMAQREIGLAIGEPPTTKGYTPSVFALLPRLLERAGNSADGSITGLYTVLVEGDDLDDPISDSARSILDGHIILSRKIASRGYYPAFDVLESVSRVKNDVISEAHKQMASQVLELMSVYRDSEDLINIGAYSAGSDPRIDAAIARYDGIIRFLRQDVSERYQFEETMDELQSLVS